MKQMFDGRIDLTGVRSIAELMERTGLSRSTCYRLTREPGFPAVRIGNRLIIDADKLSVWLAGRQDVRAEGGQNERR